MKADLYPIIKTLVMQKIFQNRPNGRSENDLDLDYKA